MELTDILEKGLWLAFEQGPYPFFLLSKDMKIVYYNAEAEKLIRKLRINEKLLGASFESLFPDVVIPKDENFFRGEFESREKEMVFHIVFLKDFGYSVFCQKQKEKKEIEESALVSLIEKIGSSTELRFVLEEISSFIISAPKFHKSSIFLKDRTNKFLERIVYKVKKPLNIHQKPTCRFEIGKEGVIGYVGESGAPYCVSNTREDPFYIGILEGEKSLVVYPLKDENQIYGVLEIGSAEYNAFSEKDLYFIERIANITSLIIRNIYVFQEAQKKFERLSLLFNIQRIFQEKKDLNRILLECINELKLKFQLDGIAIWRENNIICNGFKESEKEEVINILSAGVSFESHGTIQFQDGYLWFFPFKNFKNHFLILNLRKGNILYADEQDFFLQATFILEMLISNSEQERIPSKFSFPLFSETGSYEADLMKFIRSLKDNFNSQKIAIYRYTGKAWEKIGAIPENWTVNSEYFEEPIKIKEGTITPLFIEKDTKKILIFLAPPAEISPQTITFLENNILSVLEFLDLKKKRNREKLLFETTKSILIAQARIENINEFLDEITRIVREYLGYLYVGILLKQEEDYIQLVSGAGYEEKEKMMQVRLKIGVDGLSGIACARREIIYVPDVEKNPYYVKVSENVQSEIAIPLISDKEVYGVLVISSAKKDAFSEDDIFLLKTFADQVTLFLKNKFQIEKDMKMLRRLSEEAQFTETVLRNLPIGILVIDSKGTIIRLNSTSEFLLHKEPNEILGSKICNILCFHKSPDEECLFEESFKNRKPIIKEKFEIDIEGEKVPFSISSTFIYNEKRAIAGAILMVEDIREVASLEEQLKRNERLSAIGRIAAYMAHEIKNPLASISTGIEFLQSSLPIDDPKKEYMEMILKEIHRLDRLIKNLLNFARRRPLNKIPTNLKTLINETLALNTRELEEKKISIETHFPEEIPDIFVDPDQIKEVFLNLIRNSIEAMSEGGVLRVAVEFYPREVLISFEDTGIGIKEEDLPQVFEPFFSTKKGGSGLGLSIVHRIVEEHGGRVLVESERGKGTKFTIHLNM